jgi:glycosyltransferase involved in cell wall biosynthesis
MSSSSEPAARFGTGPWRNGRQQVAVVLSGWPRVSEVFALNEVLALKRAGMLAAVFATKRQQDGVCQPDASELDPLITFLPDGDTGSQAAAAVQALKGVAVSGLHGYFAHQPAAVAADVAQRLGLPYSFSVHALDVRKVEPAELGRRARAAAAVICCNGDVAADVAATGQQPTLVPHGVDLHRFPPAQAPSGDVVTLLSVGRLIEKKGFSFLLEAIAMLEAESTLRPFRLRVVGDGPWRSRLEDIIAARGLGHRVELLGRRTHETLPALYAESDLIVVPSVIDSAGDRDGLPNVLLEAMASSRPVVASDVAAISTAVQHGTTGLLVPPGNARALAAALAELIEDEPRRSQMGMNGRRRVEREFELSDRTDEFCRTLELAYA